METRQRLPNFFKYPRTPHLFDAGSCTADDEVCKHDEFVAFTQVLRALKPTRTSDMGEADGGGLSYARQPARQQENVSANIDVPPQEVHKTIQPQRLYVKAEMDDQFVGVQSQQSIPPRRVYIEEKVDGANIGISFCRESRQFLVQNRSHYINAQTHPQFGSLDTWLERNREDLMFVLEGRFSTTPNDGTPKRILFGEWCAAKHSIHYTRLPDWLIAFDVYEFDDEMSTGGRFWCRPNFTDVLSKTRIATVPLIATFVTADGNHQGHMGDVPIIDTLFQKEGWISLLQRPSAFRNDDGFLEGVVIRVEESSDEGQNINSGVDTHWRLWKRVKLVRPDFINGSGRHWSKGVMVKNQIDYSWREQKDVEWYERQW
ncbi:hypothetical protein HK102_006294 [Quaeritorhiza haematococci]|nr:hypothetical protein HK102_006294 [Quaeritorhiza haematococci]